MSSILCKISLNHYYKPSLMIYIYIFLLSGSCKMYERIAVFYDATGIVIKTQKKRYCDNMQLYVIFNYNFQATKVERFKTSQSRADSLHAKYDMCKIFYLFCFCYQELFSSVILKMNLKFFLLQQPEVLVSVIMLGDIFKSMQHHFTFLCWLK